MPTVVDIPDAGVSASFPDTMTEDDIKAVVRRKFGKGKGKESPPIDLAAPPKADLSPWIGIRGTQPDTSLSTAAIPPSLTPATTLQAPAAKAPGPTLAELSVPKSPLLEHIELVNSIANARQDIEQRYNEELRNVLDDPSGDRTREVEQRKASEIFDLNRAAHAAGVRDTDDAAWDEALSVLDVTGKQARQAGVPLPEVAAGIQRAAAGGTLKTFLTPEGALMLPLMAEGATSRVLAAGFGEAAPAMAKTLSTAMGRLFVADMLAHAPGQFSTGIEALERRDYGKAAEAFAGTALTAAFVSTHGKAEFRNLFEAPSPKLPTDTAWGARLEPAPSIILKETAAKIQPVAPLTAAALAEKPADVGKTVEAEFNKPKETVAPAVTEKGTDASKISETAALHGDVQPLVEPASELSVKESGPGVQPQAEERVSETSQPEAPAKPDVAKTVGPDRDNVKAHTIETAKREIESDIASGKIPPSVSSFSELQNYVDANEYINDSERADRRIGPLGKSLGWKPDDYISFTNELIGELDKWLASRTLSSNPPTVTSTTPPVPPSELPTATGEPTLTEEGRQHSTDLPEAKGEQQITETPSPEPSKESRTPIEILNTSKAVKVSVPEGATMLQVTDTKGRKSVQNLSNINKGENPLLGADVKKIEAGSIGKDKKFRTVKGDVLVEDKVGPGMGGALYGFKGPAEIEQLTDATKGTRGQQPSLKERIQEAFAVGERLAGVKEVGVKAITALKASGDYIKRKFEGVNTVDELLKEKGVLSKELETRGWRVRQWEKEALKAVPRSRDRAAISKWLDAGGDIAELKRGLSETKPEFKQAYQDAIDLKGDLLTLAENVRNYHEARLQEAIDAGVLKDGVEDYLHRMYEAKPSVLKKAIAYAQTGLLTTNPALTKKRVFQFDWEAEKMGYRPVQSFIPRVAEYESSLARAIAARAFIKKTTTMKAPDGRPVVDIKGVGIPIEDPATGVREGTLIKPQFNPARNNEPGTPNYRGDYVNKEFPALSRWKWISEDAGGKPIYVQGDVAIHPDFVHRINALLEPSRVRYGRYAAVGRPALNLSSIFKQTMLDLSGFHQVQIAIHGMEHKVNPFNLVKEIDFENPDVDGLLKGGVTLGGDYRYSREGLAGNSLTRHIPGVGPVLESYHSWLFQDFIPRVKMAMALKALERNRDRYAGQLSDEQILNKTAMQANSAFGELNYIMLERSATARDISRLILLAPDFLEARARFAGEAFTKGGKNFGNEQRTALLLGALTMYILARVINKSVDDQYHFEPENAFSVVHNGRAYSLRTVQGDILHLIEKPLSFWMHRLNPVFGRTALELATQRDEFGRKRSFPEMMWDTASNIMPISLRSNRERSLWESMANSFGITERRWQDTDKAFQLARKWKDKHGIGERGEFIYDADKDPLRGLKIALSRNDDGAAASEIKKVLASKAYTLDKLNTYFSHYASMPFTGSSSNDKKWIQTLSDDEKKTVEAARQHKKQIKDLYLKAKGHYLAEKEKLLPKQP